jgi:hypothetical protein
VAKFAQVKDGPFDEHIQNNEGKKVPWQVPTVPNLAKMCQAVGQGLGNAPGWPNPTQNKPTQFQVRPPSRSPSPPRSFASARPLAAVTPSSRLHSFDRSVLQVATPMITDNDGKKSAAGTLTVEVEGPADSAQPNVVDKGNGACVRQQAACTRGLATVSVHSWSVCMQVRRRVHTQVPRRLQGRSLP